MPTSCVNALAAWLSLQPANAASRWGCKTGLMAWWMWLILSVAIVAMVWLALVGALLLVGRREEARALATFIPDCIVLVSRLLRDERVPPRRKLLLVAVVGYLALPFDLVPDFIPVAGQLDDAIIAAFVLRHLVRSGGEEMIRELWPGPARSLALILRLARASF
jgi:uncharacterized membrane protein YkvA (DUF1232 family)